jgi:hypothetical protein
MGRENFVERLTEIINDDNKDMKREFNDLRCNYAKIVLRKLKLNEDVHFKTRRKGRTIAYDIWSLIISNEERIWMNECDEMLKESEEDINMTQLSFGTNDTNRKLDCFFNRLFEEMELLRNENRRIIDKVEGLQKENSKLKI